MQRKTTIKVVTIIAIIALIIMSSTYTFAGISPGMINGKDQNGEVIKLNDENLALIDKLTKTISIFGSFIAVGALMVIGIKYITGSLEEKANYKKSMMPYIIGCFILFGASFIIPKITTTFSEIGTDSNSIGNQILGLIQMIGSFVAVGALMVLGIKYMMGSAEQKASYKRSMIPYLIGAILLFGAVNIARVIYDMTLDVVDTSIERITDRATSGGLSNAEVYVESISEKYKEMLLSNEYTKEQKQEELNNIKNSINSQKAVASVNAKKAKDSYGEESYEYIYWTKYESKLDEEIARLERMLNTDFTLQSY